MRISDWSSDVCSSDLDILKGLIEGEESVDIIVARGHDRDLVNRVWRMLELAEYKRRQACPGVKITRRAFGRDRRYRSEEHTSELQSLMRISYAVLCLKKKKKPLKTQEQTT